MTTWLAHNWPVVALAAITAPWAIPIAAVMLRHELRIWRRARRLERVGDIQFDSPRRQW